MRARHSFWMLVSVTLTIEAAVVGTAALLGWQLLGCYWHAIPLPEETVCVSTTWPSLSTPWVLLAVVAGVLILAVVAVVKTVYRNLNGARTVLQTLRVGRVPASETVEQAAEQVGLDGRVEEVAVNAPIAETYGLITPKVIVATGLLDRLTDQELQAVLSHEVQHVRRRDPLRLAVMRSAAAATFPFPALHQLAEHAELDTEIRADRNATDHVNTAALASALMKVLNDPHGGSDLEGAAASGIHSVRQRVRYLTDGTEPRIVWDHWRLHVSAASLIVLAVIATLLIRAVAASYVG